VAAAIGELESAAKMIRNAKQPVIYSGGRAVISGGFEEIKKLSELLIAPVFSTISGKGIMTNGPDSNYFGTIGLFGEKPNHKFIRKDADLMIVIGSRLTEDDTANFKIPPQRMDMIQIDIDPAEIGLSFNPLGVVGDCKASLQGLLQILEKDGISTESNIITLIESRKANLAKLRKEHEDYRAKDTATWITSEPIKPQRVLKAISEVLGANDYLVTDASASARWIGPYYPVKSTGLKIITARGVGPTGFGLGALIGTCVATRELYGIENAPKVVLFTGDGGLMNAGVADLETIVRLKLNCTIVIINNSSLGFVKFGQAMLYKQRYLDTDRPQTNFPAIGQAFGGTGIRVERLADLDDTIKTAINAKGLNIVDVITDPQEFLPPNFY
jgi:acetolactate synthase-1/2/3 large subunit